MRFFLLHLVPAVVLFACFTSPVRGDEKADADLKAMVGKWKVEKAEFGGKDITVHLKEMKFEILPGGKYTVEVGKETDAGSFTVDVSKSPKEMDVKPTGGPNKDKLVKAIYKLDGDTLTMSFDHEAESGKRPAKFESKEGTTMLLIVYQREKK